MGDAIPLPDGVTRVRVAPGDAYVLVEQGTDNPMGIVWTTPAGAAPSIQVIEGAMSTADLVAFSPSGSAAALYSKSTGRLQVIAGLADSPRVSIEVAAGTLGIQPVVVAVSDDAGALLASDVSGGVYLLAADNPPALLYQTGAVASMAFFPRSQDAVVADRAQKRVLLLRQVSANCSVQWLADENSTVDHPGAVAGMAGGTVLIASTNDRRLWMADTRSGEITAVDLPVIAEFLRATRDASTFLLSSSVDGPAWLFAVQPGGGAAFFVPNGRPDATAVDPADVDAAGNTR